MSRLKVLPAKPLAAHCYSRSVVQIRDSKKPRRPAAANAHQSKNQQSVSTSVSTPNVMTQSSGLLLSFSSFAEVPERLSRESSMEKGFSWEESLRASSSLEMMEKLNRLDQSITEKVAQSFVSNRQVEEEALRLKVLEVEKAPTRKRSVPRKTEGLNYDSWKLDQKASLVTRSKTKRNTYWVQRRTSNQSAINPSLSMKSGLKRNCSISNLKSSSAIQQDLKKTRKESCKFLRSALTLSKQLSQCFLKAPVLRPHSKAFLVLTKLKNGAQ